MAVATLTPLRRLRVAVRGAVQGVGFRPFVYRLASELALTGWVINDSRGVELEVEGPPDQLERFLARLQAERPPRSLLLALEASWHDPAGYPCFEIRHSDNQGARTTLILPDAAVCPDCLAEVFDAADRRYRYPFTNCTNCGPRLTIVRALPYDRVNTTMRTFLMCPACQREYDDPADRRFHAQPNACPACGPQLAFWVAESGCSSASATLGDTPAAGKHVAAVGEAALAAALQAITAGQIVAVKGLGGFHLLVDAGNEAAVGRLRQRKQREQKPLALMVRDQEQALSLCSASPGELALLAAPEAPIVLLRRRPGAPVAGSVAPGNPYLGLMLPYTPLHHLLLRGLAGPVVATSGNLSDEPICIDEADALARLAAIADAFLVHNRPIERHADDSIAAVVAGAPRLLRRARGYAPLPVLLPHEAPCILAVGGHLKNAIALSVGRQVFISQHIGDLETPGALAAHTRAIDDFLRLYEAQPVAVACDLHPDYASTQAARALRDGPLSQCVALPVQHHHAHLAACLAEHAAAGPALGVIWDGAGYGTDGTIWGGEFLLGDAAAFERVAHLWPLRLPGGDAAARDGRRAALALLWETYGDAAFEQADLAPLRALNSSEQRLFQQMLRRGTSAPLTTSAGRLFDGVAALLGLCLRSSYEGQAAMALEFAAGPAASGAYPFVIGRARPLPAASLVIDWRPAVAALLADLRRSLPTGTIAARFHNTLVESIVAVARRVAIERVALSGGCFLNRWLTEHAARRLAEEGFEVLLHRQVPPGDGGLCLGQVAVAAAQLTGSGAYRHHQGD